jgi:hypothetical protein
MWPAFLKKSVAGDESDSSSVTVAADPSTWNFDIDRYLNRFVPAPRWRLVPYPVAHFLGHRKDHRVDRLGNIPMTFWAFIGIFSAILLIELASRSIAVVEQSGLLIVASFVRSRLPL